MVNDEFFDIIDDEVTERFLEQKFGHAAKEEHDLPTVTRPVLEAILEGEMRAFNEALSNGNVAMAAVHYRAVQRLLEVDDEIAQAYEDLQQNPLEALTGENVAAIFGPGGPPF